MPVYRLSELIHIHIPKTGGTAIESYFHSIGDMVWGLESWLGQEYIEHRWYEIQHLTMREFIDFTADEFKHFDSFAVIRNPYTRLISEYLWRRALSQGTPNVQMLFFDSFREFLLEIPPEIDTNWSFCLDKADRAKTNFLIHVRPQHHYVCSQHGEQMVNELMSFERLATDFNVLLGRRGLKTNKIRSTRARHLEAYFDRETLDLANSLYAKDFKLGAYEML